MKTTDYSKFIYVMTVNVKRVNYKGLLFTPRKQQVRLVKRA